MRPNATGYYTVIVDGWSPDGIAKIARNGATINDNDIVTRLGNRVALTGRLSGGIDAYELDRGEVASVMTTDDAIDVSY